MILSRLGGWIAERQKKKASCNLSTWLVLVYFVTLFSSVAGCQQVPLETEISKYRTKVSDARTYPAAEQGTIASYLGIEETWHKISTECDKQDLCPDIFLFDAPIERHHNLGFEVVGYKDSSATKTNASGNIVVGYNDEEHGTAMAGIIGARRVETGVIGVNPSASLLSIDWNYYRSDNTKRKELTKTLAERVTQHTKTNHLHIMLFAKDWASDSGPSVNPCSQRQNGDILGNLLVSITTPLIIAPAGDVKEGASAVDIGPSYTQAPENMGDCENVIVVTACHDCTSSTPKVSEQANFSTAGLVHIAAFGDDVLSTGSADRLTILPGDTSTAAAFVTGVASAMVSRWPGTYRDLAWLVKFRLQISSTPSLTGSDRLKVSAGVMNPELAFQNPEVDYLSAVSSKQRDQPTKTNGWCVDQIEVSKDGGTSVDIIPVFDIYRIYCSQINRCSIYHADDVQRRLGKVFRSGPGELVGHVLAVGSGQSESSNRKAQVIFKADERLFTALDFTDLLLHDPMPRLAGGLCAP